MKTPNLDRRNDFGRGLLAGSLAGSALGVALGLLLASERGRLWVRTLRARRPESADAPAFFDDSNGSSGPLVNYGKRQGDDLVRDIHDRAETLRKDAERLLHEIKDKSSRLPAPPTDTARP